MSIIVELASCSPESPVFNAIRIAVALQRALDDTQAESARLVPVLHRELLSMRECWWAYTRHTGTGGGPKTCPTVVAELEAMQARSSRFLVALEASSFASNT